MNASDFLSISRVAIRDFRCLAELELDLDPDTTLLVGENNAGKTSILLAVAAALGHRRASLDDLRRDSTGRPADSAHIDVFFSPPTGKTSFADEMRQRLIAVQREPVTGDEVLGFRCVLRPSGEGSILVEDRKFLQPLNGAWATSPIPSFQPRVLELVQAQFMDASRDLIAEMGNRTSSWGRVLSDLRIPELPNLDSGEPNPLAPKGLERDLRAISDRVRQASPVLTELQRDLEQITHAQTSVGNVDLVALPLRIEELARSIEVVLHQKGAAGLPLRFHGAGSRSLAALLVFQTMCSLKLGADQGVKPHLLTLLEEPEAHLHPHAVMSLIPMVERLPGQRLVSTHSPTLVAEANPLAVRVVRREGAKTRVQSITRSREKDLEKFRRFFGRPFAELFFARLAILGDGAAERNALPWLIAMDLGGDPAGYGISFVDCKSMGDATSINPLLRVFDELEIPWICLADNDQAGCEALGRLKDPRTGEALCDGHDNVVLLTGTKQLEQLLIDADYRSEIGAVAAEAGFPAGDDKELLSFLTANKAWAPEAVARRAHSAQRSAPHHLSPLLHGVRDRLGLQASEPAVAPA